MAESCPTLPPPAPTSEVVISHRSHTDLRCVLFFPGSRPELHEKARGSGAPSVCMDLEDAVAPEAKEDARAAAVRVVERARPGGARLVIRVNHPATPDGEADLLALSAARRSSDARTPLSVMVPKVEGEDDVKSARSRFEGDAAVDLVPVIETALGLERAAAIASVESVSALLFGGLDLSLDLGAALAWEPLLYARSRVVHAARLGAVPAIDMPFLDVSDGAALREEALRARALGFRGKAAIHPGQVQTVLEAFAPTAAELARARAVAEAAEGTDEGVFVVDGVMVDRPEIEAARRVLSWDEDRDR